MSSHQNSNNRIRIEVPPFLACMLNAQEGKWLVLEPEIGQKTTIEEALKKLVKDHPEFGKIIYNPDVGEVGEQVTITVNDNLIQPEEVTRTILNGGDKIVLFPIYTGG